MASIESKQLEYVLEQLRFSDALPRDVLEQFAHESKLAEFSAGEVVFREGGRADQLYLLSSGRIALEMNVPGRGAVRILTLGPGEMFGWSSLLGRGKMTTSAVVVEDAAAIVVPAKKLVELSEANRDFGYHLMRRMAAALSQRLVATRLQLLDLFAASPATRAWVDSEEKEGL